MNLSYDPFEAAVFLFFTILLFFPIRKSRIFDSFFYPPLHLKKDRRSIKESISKLMNIALTYVAVELLFILSGISIDAIIVNGIKLYSEEIFALSIQIALITGIIIAVFARIYALCSTTSLVKAFHFYAYCTFSTAALFSTPIFPSINLGTIIKSLVWDYLLKLSVNVYFEILSRWLIFLLVITFITELIIPFLLSGEKVCISIFREQREMADSVELYLGRSNVVDAAKDLINNAAEEILWVTGMGTEEVAEKILLRKSILNTIKIIATPEVYDRWGKKDHLKPLLENVRKSKVGSLRFMVVDRKIALEAIKMPPKDVGADVAIKVEEISRIKQLITIFEQWWNDLDSSYTTDSKKI